MSVDSAPGIAQVLCVQVDNSPLSGRFLTDPGVVPIETLSSPGVARAATYNPAPRAPSWTPATFAEQAGQYVAGGRIQASVITPSGVRPVSGGWWALPAPDASGLCATSPADYAGVRVEVPPRQCLRAPALLSPATCEAWGAQRLVSQLILATGPGKNPSPATNPPLGAANDWVGVALGGTWTGNASTGFLSAAGPLSSPGGLTPVFTPGSATLPGSQCSCAGVVTSIAYTVSYAGTSGALTGVSADVVLANVTGEYALGACSAPLSALPLTVSLQWVDDASPAPPPALGRSGSPGYTPGAPVLSGAMVTQEGAPYTSAVGTDKLAVVRGAPANSRLAAFGGLRPINAALAGAAPHNAVVGLSLRGPGVGGACAAPPTAPGTTTTAAAAATAGLDEAGVVGVTFGEDVSISCTLALDEPSLAAMCAASAARAPPYYGFWAVNNTLGAPAAPTHVGTLGNAHPWKSWQWTPITPPLAYPPQPLTYDAGNKVCLNMPATLAVEFLTAAVGEASNPQNKILGVRYRYIPDSWAFTREDVRTAGGSSAYTQTYALTTTVTWTRLGTGMPEVYVAPPPSLIPTLPSDLWFPFST